MQQLYPWVSDLYFERLPHAFLADHPMDFLLSCGLMCDVVELEDLLLCVSLDHQLVLVGVRKVNASEFGVSWVWFESDDDLDLLLFVYSTIPTH